MAAQLCIVAVWLRKTGRSRPPFVVWNALFSMGHRIIIFASRDIKPTYLITNLLILTLSECHLCLMKFEMYIMNNALITEITR